MIWFENSKNSHFFSDIVQLSYYSFILFGQQPRKGRWPMAPPHTWKCSFFLLSNGSIRDDDLWNHQIWGNSLPSVSIPLPLGPPSSLWGPPSCLWGTLSCFWNPFSCHRGPSSCLWARPIDLLACRNLIADWMNKWMNERMNKWMNEKMATWMNEWMRKWINDCMNEWTNKF